MVQMIIKYIKLEILDNFNIIKDINEGKNFKTINNIPQYVVEN